MYQTKLNKIGNLIESIKNDLNLPIVSDFLEWFYEKLDLHFNLTVNSLDLQKGDVFYVNLGKNIGSELNKTRPCIVYSKKFTNKGDTVVVIPLKSYKGKINKDLFLLLKSNTENILKRDSLVDVCGIRQISKKRLKGYVGKISENELQKIDKKLSKVFGITNKE